MAAARDLTAAEYHAMAELRYQIRRFLVYRDGACRDAGLEPQQYQMLLTIKGQPAEAEVTVGLLSRRMMVRHHSAVEMVDRLVANGLVTRVRDRSDRRKAIVKLTKKGGAVLRELALLSREDLRTSGKTLVEVLRRLVHGK